MKTMSKKTTWVKLKDVCDTMSGGTPSRDIAAYYGGDIPWVKSGELLDGLITDTEEKITKAAVASSSAKLFSAGTLLIALYGATVGRLGILGIDATTNQAVCGITPNEQLDRDFLFYYLLKQREKLIDSRTGGAQPNINQEIIRELDIPLPPLTEQKRIASLLARADRLRQLRRTAYDLGVALLQSVFLEMFGDPVTNSKKLNVEKLEGFTNLVSSGSTPLGGSNVYTASGIRFIRSQNVLMNKFDFSDIAFISEEIYNSMKRTVVKRNDVLLNITGASIGRVACYQDDFLANVNQHVCIIRCKPEKLNPIYLSYVLSMPSFQEKFITNQSGATRQALNFEQIKDFNIPIPPLSLQEELAPCRGSSIGLGARAVCHHIQNSDEINIAKRASKD